MYTVQNVSTTLSIHLSAFKRQAHIMYLSLPVLVCSVDSTLTQTNPGSLCSGKTVMLICNVNRTTGQRWFYGGDEVVLVFFRSFISIRFPDLMQIDDIAIDVQTHLPLVQGVNFSISVSSTTPLVSQLSFVANNTMNGKIVSCEISTNTLRNESIILQVENQSKSLIVLSLKGYCLMEFFQHYY